MRLHQPNLTTEEQLERETFASWLLQIGDGKIGQPDKEGTSDTRIVEIPTKFLIPYSKTSLTELISFIYDIDTISHPTVGTFGEKAIVCPKNETADYINSLVLDMVIGNTMTYLSNDSVIPNNKGGADIEVLYPKEYLALLDFPNLPPHRDNNMSRAKISDLITTKKHNPLDIRVINKWIPYRSTQLCFLFVDEQGDAIEAITEASTNKNLTTLLTINNCYCIKDYICAPSRKTWKVVTHASCIRFGKNTSITTLEAPHIPNHYLNFASYDQLVRRIDDNTLLTDYIGRLTAITDIAGNSEDRTFRLQLIDESYKAITVTIWPQSAKMVDTNWIQQLQQPILIAVTSMKVTGSPEKPHLSSTNSTIITANPVIPQFHTLAARFASPIENYSQQITQSTIDVRAPMLLSEIVRNFSQQQNAQTYMCVASVIDIQCDNQHVWFYESCPECKKKVYEVEGRYECDVHDPTTEPTYRYCVTATIADKTTFCNVTLFEEAMSSLIDITCPNMVKERNYNNPHILPEPLNTIKGKEMMFHLRSRRAGQYRPSIVVNKVTPLSTTTTDVTITRENAINMQLSPSTPDTKLGKRITTSSPGDDQQTSKQARCSD